MLAKVSNKKELRQDLKADEQGQKVSTQDFEKMELPTKISYSEGSRARENGWNKGRK